MNGNSALDELETFDGTFRLQVLKEFLNDMAEFFFCVAAGGLADSGAFENIGESKRRRHFVSLDFSDAAHNVIFESDDERSVVLSRHVQKFGIVAKNLVALLGDNHDRRFVEKVNHVVDGLPVDGGGNEFAGQNGRAKALFLAVIIAERLVGIRQVNVDNGLHEFGDAVLNCLALIFVDGAIAGFAGFAGKGAEYNGESRMDVADFLLTEAGGENSRVKFCERILIVVAVGVADFVSGSNSTVFLMVAFLDNAAFHAVD